MPCVWNKCHYITYYIIRIIIIKYFIYTIYKITKFINQYNGTMPNRNFLF